MLMFEPLRAEATIDPKLSVVLNGEVLERIKHPAMGYQQPYVPLRLVSESLGATLHWDDVVQQAVIFYRDRTFSTAGILQDGRLMVSPEWFSYAFGVNMRYDQALNAVVFAHGAVPNHEELLGILPRFDGYNYEDVYWLARIVEAEARGETYESRLAVANVVLNRRDSDLFPSTVREVIFDRQHGIQFTPTANGAINNQPSALSFLAALDALDGRNNAPGALFFLNPNKATNFWIPNNRTYAFTIGGHSYFY